MNKVYLRFLYRLSLLESIPIVIKANQMKNENKIR